jgi:DNA-binding beta-propeller fold protein YncE
MYAKIPSKCLLICIAAMFLSACATTQPAQTTTSNYELQWPARPAAPKIKWIKQVRNYQDMGLNKGFWKRVWGFIVGESVTDIIKPYGIYSDDKKRLFVVDVEAGVVHVFDSGTGRYSEIEGKDGIVFKTPIGITGDNNDTIYITDSDGGQIYIYKTKEESLKRFTSIKLQRPTGVAYNKTNRLLYVSDTAAHQVIAIDLEGKEKFRFGGRGISPGQFNFPTDLAIDGAGRVVVTDALNARIQTFSADGHLMGSFGKAGDTAGNFAKPKGVAVDSEGHIYVCDALFDSVQIFDANGKLLLFFGESGGKPGQFWMPSGIHIDGNDYIYVADTYNKRVQVFRYLK